VFLFQSIQSVLPIELGFFFLVYAHWRSVMYNVTQKNGLSTVNHEKWGVSCGTIQGSL
jgi:hypothetical protein